MKSEEYKQTKKSVKVLSETVTKLEETVVTKADLLEFLLKEKETPKKKKEKNQKKEEPRFTCCFDTEDAVGGGGNKKTLLVNGFDCVRSMDEIRKDLRHIFGSYGEVKRVFVPIECKTRVPLGFAFIDLKNGEGIEEALMLNNSRIRGRKLKVKMAKDSFKSHAFPDFEGCENCQVSKSNPRYYQDRSNNYKSIPPMCY